MHFSRKSSIFLALLITVTTPAFAQDVLDQSADWGPIGTHVEGSVDYSNGVYTLEGNGNDIQSSEDEGFYAYTDVSGNFQMEGFVQWIDPGTNEWAKIGLMVRDNGDDASSKHYWILTRGAQDQVQIETRPSTNGGTKSQEVFWPADSSKVATENGIWLRITRFADSDYLYTEFSQDGEEWIYAHSTGFPMEDPVSVGFAITNHDDNEFLAQASAEDVVLRTGDDVASPEILSEDAIGDFEGHADIGYFQQVGSASYSDGSYTIQGSGADIWGSEDDFHYVYREMSGNFDAEFEMTMTQVGEPTWTKIGAMVRQNLDWNARYGYVMINTEGDFTTAGRNTRNTGAYDRSMADINGTATAYRLRKVGSVVNGYYQDENGDWISHGAIDTNIAEPFLFGLAVTSHDRTLLAEGVFDNVQISPLNNGIMVRRDLSKSTFVQTDDETATVTLTATGTGSEPTTDVPITETPPAGWEVSNISNDGTMSDGIISWAPITLAPGETQTFTYEITAPIGVDGGTVSFDGTVENPNGNIQIAGTVDASLLTPVGDFDGSLNIGDANTGGQTTFDNGDYNVTGAGSDIWNDADDFHFTFKKIEGSFSFKASIIPENVAHTWAKVGIMVRDNLSRESKNYFAMIRAETFDGRVQYRPTEGAATSETGTTANHFGDFEIVRFGDTLEWYYITDDTNERVLGHSMSLPMDEPVYAGLAVSNNDNSSTFQNGIFFNVEFEEYPFTPSMSVSDYKLAPGESTEVTVELDMREGVDANNTVTQSYPTNTMVSNISSNVGTATDDGSGTITWDIDETADVATMTYTLTVEEDATGTGTISGSYTDNADYSGDFNNVILAYYNFDDPSLEPFASHVDLAEAGAVGDVGRIDDNWGIIGSGNDIWGTSDQAHYLYLKSEGNFKVTIEDAYIDGVGNNPSSNVWQKFGIMARQSLDANSANAFAMIRSSDQAFRLQWREEAGLESFSDGDPSLVPADTHTGTISLEREDDFFITYYIDNNGEEQYNNEHAIIMDDPIYVGIAVTSHDRGLTSIGTFSNVTFEGTTVSVNSWMLY